MVTMGNVPNRVLKSDLIVNGNKWFRWVEKALCIDCYCHEASHSMRVWITGEIRKEERLNDIEVTFGFSSDRFYPEEEWTRYKTRLLSRFVRFVNKKKRDIKMAVSILLGKRIYLCPDFSMFAQEAKQFAGTLIEEIEVVEKSLEEYRVEVCSEKDISSLGAGIKQG